MVLKSVLAIDIGTKRVGFALKPAGLSLCVPIDAKAADPSTAASNTLPITDVIVNVVVQKSPDIIVIGLPLAKDGTTTPMSEKISSIGEKLKLLLLHKGLAQIQVEFHDEALSSVTAQETLNSASQNKKGSYKQMKKTREQGVIDSLAALEILKAYLGEKGVFV